MVEKISSYSQVANLVVNLGGGRGGGREHGCPLFASLITVGVIRNNLLQYVICIKSTS
jgi:hypothetical protein